MAAEIEALLTEQHLAKLLGCDARALQAARRSMLGPAYLKLGRSIFYRRDAVQTWLEVETAVCTEALAALRPGVSATPSARLGGAFAAIEIMRDAFLFCQEDRLRAIAHDLDAIFHRFADLIPEFYRYGLIISAEFEAERSSRLRLSSSDFVSTAHRFSNCVANQHTCAAKTGEPA